MTSAIKENFPPRRTRRWLSPKVEVDGEPLGLCYVTVDGAGQISVRPFGREEADTTFFDGTIRIDTNTNRVTLEDL